MNESSGEKFESADAQLVELADSPRALSQFIDQLLQHSQSLTDNDGETLAHYAARRKNGLKTLQLLVQRWGPKCLMETDQVEGVTPVHLSAWEQSEDTMKFVKEVLGADAFYTEGFRKRTVFHFAAENYNSDSTLKWLVQDQGATCLTLQDERGHTPAHFVALHQNEDTMEFVKQRAGTEAFYSPGPSKRTVFHFAAMNKRSDAILRWLSNDQGHECLSLTDEEGDTPVHLSAEYQNWNTMQFVKETVGADVFYSRGALKRTVFHQAALNEKTNAVLKWLVQDQGHKCLTLTDEYGNTPVHYSAEFQNEDTMKFVKKTIGAQVFYSEGQLRRTAFHCAALNENTDAVLKWLVEDQGENCLTLANEKGCTPVHLSARFQKEGTMKFLKETIGAGLPCPLGECKRTIFHYAAMNKKTNSVLRWLVEDQGHKSLTLTDEYGLTPVHLSAEIQNEDTMKFVKEKIGVNCFYSPGYLKRSVFHCAALNVTTNSVLKWLIKDQGHNCLTLTDEQGNTPIHLSAWKQNEDTMKFVKETLGAHAFYPTGAMKRTVFHCAAMNETTNSVLKWLVEDQGHKLLFAKDKLGSTPVHLCAQYQNEGTMKFVKDRIGADVFHLQGPLKRTVFHYAAMNENTISVLKWLVEDQGHKCLTVPDEEGATPVHYCAKRQSKDALKFVKETIGSDAFYLRSFSKRTVFHFAAQNEKTNSVLEWLVQDQGPDCLTLADEEGVTAVHLSAGYKNQDTLKFVKDTVGAKAFYITTALKRTVFHFAAMNSKTNSVLKWLVEDQGHECLIQEDETNATPAHLSAACQNADAVKFVKDTVGPRVFYSQGPFGRTVFHFAALNENTDSVLKWLVNEQGADCLTLTDKEGMTPVNLCAYWQNEETMKFLKEIIGSKQLNAHGPLKRTVFHFAAMNEKTNSVLKWLIEDQGHKSLTQKDQNGTTPVHLSAQFHNEDSMKMVKDMIGAGAFYSTGVLERTVFHQAALNEKTNSVLKWLVQDQGPSCLNLRDSANASVVHLAVWHQDTDSLQFIQEQLGSECFMSRGHLNRPTICYAARNENTPHAVQFVLKLLGPKCLLEADEVGRNFFHFCAFNPKFGVRLLRKMVKKHGTALNLKSEADAINKFVDNDGRTPLHFACLMKNLSFVEEFLPCIQTQNVSDADGNTLLHSLFQVVPKFGLESFIPSRFVSCLTAMIEAGIDVSAENARKQNCLMAAELFSTELVHVIAAVSETEALKSKFEKLLTNSEGMHASHAFSSRYELQKLLKSISELSGKSDEHFLHIRVASGQNRGATCLHFACEAGHKNNIKFLIGRGLKLSDLTENGQSCIDFACNKGTLDAVLDAGVQSDAEAKAAVCLIDPPTRALQLPQRSSARSLLSTFVDSKLSTNVLVKRRDDGSGSSIGRKEAVDEDEAPASQLLFRAVELDSAEMLRSLLILGFSVETSDMDLKKILESKASEERQNFPYAAQYPKHCSKSDAFQFAVYFNKLNIAADLVLIRQFDLIPKCIILLILLKTKTQGKDGKLEQLSDLQRVVTGVVMNALDSLYNNGDELKKEMVYRFLTADYKGGPKFEFHEQVHLNLSEPGKDVNARDESRHYSVEQLLHILDSDEVFGTDCLSRFVDRQWTRRAAESSIRQSGRVKEDAGAVKKDSDGASCSWFTMNAKFYIYSFAFLIFLVYLAWFITDFRRTFNNRVFDIVMYLYAASFTAQEINDFAARFELVQIFRLRRWWTVPRYMLNVFNYFDISALTFMWVGLIWKSVLATDSDNAVYSCQMVMATSFLLWGFRSVSLLSFFKIIGPKVSMLRSLLLKDLLSLLGLLAVIFYSFSVFFISLLYPADSSSDSRNGWDVVKEIWKFPALLAFGLFETDDLQSCNRSLVHSSWLDCAHDVGHTAFSSFFVFVFMLLVNIVMWNLLIALFSLTVARKASRAVVIWRKSLFDLLKEFEEMSVLPPPVSIAELGVRWMAAAASWCRRCCRGGTVAPSERATFDGEWWRSEDWSKFPKEFRQFLQYQAVQLRQSRPNLLRRVEKHRSDTEALKAFTENSMANSREQISREVATVRDNIAQEVATVREEVKDRLLQAEKKQRRRVKKMRRQMDEVLQLLHRLEQQQQQQQQQ